MSPPTANFFAPEEENFIIHLKETIKPELSWEQIHKNYTKQFPRSPRSRGGLQVHYSRSLQPSKRKLRRTISSIPSVLGSDTEDETISTTSPKTPKSTENLDTMNNSIASRRPQRAAAKSTSAYKFFEGSESPLSERGMSPLNTRSSPMIMDEDTPHSETDVKDKDPEWMIQGDISNNSSPSTKNSNPESYRLTIRVNSNQSSTKADAPAPRPLPPRKAKLQASLLDDAPLMEEGMEIQSIAYNSPLLIYDFRMGSSRSRSAEKK